MSKKSFWKDIKDFAIVIGAYAIIQAQVMAHTVVPTGSMIPTINIQDRLIINKLATKFTTPDRGDVVVFLKEDKFPLNEYWVKRVIGVPNDTIDLIDGDVYVNGELLEENYTIGETIPLSSSVEFPYTVPEEHYFVMGDNRENSHDSRAIGSIREEDIIAIGAFKIYPLSDIGVLK